MTNLRSVKAWLERFDLGELNHVFVENEIDLDAARDLSEQDLRELGLAMGPRKKLLRAIATLNERDPANQIIDGIPSASSSPGVSVVGDRRQVTVLFADICGYTKLSGELGPRARMRCWPPTSTQLTALSKALAVALTSISATASWLSSEHPCRIATTPSVPFARRLQFMKQCPPYRALWAARSKSHRRGERRGRGKRRWRQRDIHRDRRVREPCLAAH